MSPGTPLNPSLEAVGFDTCYFVYNLGSLFLSIIYIFIKMVTAIILRFFRRKSKKVKGLATKESKVKFAVRVPLANVSVRQSTASSQITAFSVVSLLQIVSGDVIECEF